jgi:methionyl-tRNA formyltransferase
VYFGTPTAAVAPLRALVEAGFEIPLVISRADRRRGRRGQPTPSPVKAAALELGLDVSTDMAEAGEVGADCGVVVAYGRIIPEALLEQLPMINIHFSLLPKWRGAAPVERAILAGDATTGVCVMAVDVELDTGAVYSVIETPIGLSETADELRSRLVDIGSEQLVGALREGLTSPVAQEGESTYAEKINRSDLELDWSKDAESLHRTVRVGGAWTTFRAKSFKVHAARVVQTDVSVSSTQVGELDGDQVVCGAGRMELVTVQPEGKPRLDMASWANGARLEPGERLGH